jgi:tetratricopeptide (TPR) repeat protein
MLTSRPKQRCLMDARVLRLVIAGLVASAIVTKNCPTAQADEFKLKDGRTLIGKLIAAPKADAKQWTVQLAAGTFVRFDNDQLAINGHIKTEERLEKYRQSLQNVEPTAESHAGLAGWCNSNGLREQAEAHYRRALDFNPDFRTARTALNYREDASGRWVERDQLMTEGKGKVKVGGRFVYSEVYAIEVQKAELEKKTGAWNPIITRLQRDVIAGKTNSQKALDELQQISDPFAVPALSARLLDSKTPTKLQMLYVQLLSQFQIPESVGPLVQASLTDDDPVVRDACLDSLAKFGREVAVSSYIRVLQAVAAKPQDNAATIAQVNRAATGLNALKAGNAVLPLISALVTEYRVTRQPQNNYDSSGAFTTGGKPVTTVEKSQNNEVLSTLSTMTGQNFGFDEAKWMRWYAATYAAPMGDLRRDP